MSVVTVSLQGAQELINESLGSGIAVMLSGPPGIGKSEGVYQVARKNGIGFVDLRASQLDPTDLRGLPWVDKEINQARWARPVFLPDAERDGPEGILLLDEITSAPPSVQAALYQLVLNHRIGEYTLPKGWSVVAAGNRLGDRSVVFRMAKALANRFKHLNVVADVGVWRQWAYQAGIDSRIIGFIQFKGEAALLDFRPDNEEDAFASPRTWTFANLTVKRRLPERLVNRQIDSITFADLAGCIGSGMATEFVAYVHLTDALPSIDRILDIGDCSPAGLAFDVKHAALTGITGGLLSRFRSQADDRFQPTVSRAMGYVGQMEAEFGALFFSDLKASTEMAMAVYRNSDYQSWLKQNHHLIVQP